MNDPLLIARGIAHKRCDDLYNSIWKAVYLHELSGRMDLNDGVLADLQMLREEIAQAVGISPTNIQSCRFTPALKVL